ncbi:type VI secretion system contractile sheath large subunit [Rubrivivax sp. JA1029]|uniref:type VI secretion system contractile sheath large subunit n=1 Tax=Rubrivivax sp. JA1029 TaxID=2894193 RepID=UPI001E41F506|nr:type VI secretion system contractile sheath large subunit [Rubrivivax sp. JA1029]MCC9645941.1 type VI secretion system contractile sheath large subunit [Rubrivivax sp. JA1029]
MDTAVLTPLEPLPPPAPDLLDRLVLDSRVARGSAEHGRARELIAHLAHEVASGSVTVADNLGVALDARIAELDELISAQLDEILHHPRFQRLEAAWNGLHYLCRHAAGGPLQKIAVLDATQNELVRDFSAAIDFDQSALFRLVYEEAFGSFGGAPFGALVGDYEIGRGPEDLYFVEQMSHVAAAAHAPFIAAASAELFGLDGFTEIGRPRDLAKVFDTAEYARWKSLRASEDARYVGLVLPRFLGRLPYDARHGTGVEGFGYVERVDGSDHSRYLWVNAAYALAARLNAAFAAYGWCAAIRGVEGGGLVEGLPTHTYRTDDGERALKCPTEVAITDRSEKELADLGFIPLVHCQNTDYAAFFAAQSVHRPRRYDSDAANANAALAAQLQYVFSVCRIAHYLKAMMREKVGSFASAANVEEFLNRWIRQYVVEDDSATQETKAAYPLREASVHVSEMPGRAGAYRAVAFVRPHFQLDELSVSLRLVAELAPRGT